MKRRAAAKPPRKEAQHMNYIKKHAKQIITTFIFSIILAYLLSLNRPYSAFGGEDLIPITVIFIWIFKFIDEKERKK